MHFGLSGHFIKVLQDDTPIKLGAYLLGLIDVLTQAA